MAIERAEDAEALTCRTCIHLPLACTEEPCRSCANYSHFDGGKPLPIQMIEKEGPESHPLYSHLLAAIEQAMYGKGERHGGATVPFLEQPIFHYAKMHGRGFLTGQAAKKLEEAASTRSGEAFRQEVLGAIVYAGAALIWESLQQPKGTTQ